MPPPPTPPSTPPDLWRRAASFAARRHDHTYRKGADPSGTRTPYIAHPFRVAMTVRHTFGVDDPVALTAALLHDTIEDTGTDFDDIAESFGQPTATVVAALTKDMRLPHDAREPAYDAQLAAAPWQARLIKLADAYDNLLDTLDAHHPPEKPRSKLLRALALAESNPHPAFPQALAAAHALLAAHP